MGAATLPCRLPRLCHVFSFGGCAVVFFNENVANLPRRSRKKTRDPAGFFFMTRVLTMLFRRFLFFSKQSITAQIQGIMFDVQLLFLFFFFGNILNFSGGCVYATLTEVIPREWYIRSIPRLHFPILADLFADFPRVRSKKK